MQTPTPSFARRSAMPRPMRLAAPVTSTILPARSVGMFWFGQAAGDVGPAPEYRGGRAERSRYRSDHTRIHGPRRDAAGRHREHHHGPLRGFDGGKDASAVAIVHVPQKLGHVQHGADPDR